MPPKVPQYITKPKAVGYVYHITISQEGLRYLQERLDNSDYYERYKKLFAMNVFLKHRIALGEQFHFNLRNQTVIVTVSLKDITEYQVRTSMTRVKRRLNELCSPLKLKEYGTKTTQSPCHQRTKVCTSPSAGF